MRYVAPSKDEIDAMPPEQAEFHNVSTPWWSQVERAKALPIVDNVDMSSRYGRKRPTGCWLWCACEKMLVLLAASLLWC